ncbi:hypothetical protein BTO06_01240 [Tenacibaculum sp. SZ-18]|uniref:hypothetical protein n=1 Tax=Tenacibaculum sp. SZ-18 TaxID=754423 RepID=UPI000C2D2BE5|nr:hypothetical protein [Tenacibaculum sp. SZ-18]AUC13858.1 hypothetical protein BTO06_01240 [Tenacibaculum sp. SZ-18]
MKIRDKILPREANNDYQGSKIAYYTLILITIIFFVRSMIHFLAPDSGVQMIATIVKFEGNPDPNRIVYMFSSLGGAMQLIMVIVYAIVLFCYRNLIPLMFVLLLIETVFRKIVVFIHPLTPNYFESNPPGTYVDLPLFIISAIMIYLSTRTIKKVITE